MNRPEQISADSTASRLDAYESIIALSGKCITDMLLRMIAGADSYHGWAISDQDGERLVKLVSRKQRIICSSFTFQLKKHFAEFKSDSDQNTGRAPNWQRIGLTNANEAVEVDELKAITSRYSDAFKGFDRSLLKRMQHCVKRSRAHIYDNPVQVKRLLETFRYSIHSLNLETNFKLALYQLFATRFIETLGPFYRKIEQQLLDEGICKELPPSRIHLRNFDGLSESKPGAFQPNTMVTQLALVHRLKQQSQQQQSDYHNQFSKLKQQLLRYSVIDNTDCLDQLNNMFKLMFEDQDLPNEIKQQLARLQTFVYLTALQDHEFFTRSSNPVRRLLDTIISLEVEFVVSARFEHTGLHFIRKHIDHLVELNVINSDSFANMLVHYQAYLSQKENQIEKSIKANAMRNLVPNVKARLGRLTEVLQHNGSSMILFDKVWLPLLVQIALQKGFESNTWSTATAMVETQVWTLTSKSSKQDYDKLRSLSPRVIHALARAMRSLKLETGLAQSLADYLKLELQNVISETEKRISEAKPKRLAAPISSSHEDAEEFSEMMQTGKFQITEEMLIAMNTPKKQATETLAEEHRMKKGDWVEISRGGDRVNAKLAWHAEDYSLYIFIDREGNRVCEIDAATLERRLVSGDISVLNSGSVKGETTQFSIMNTFNSR